MKIKANVKSGGSTINHHEVVVSSRKTRGMKVKTNIKSGGIGTNHNETMLHDSRNR